MGCCLSTTPPKADHPHSIPSTHHQCHLPKSGPNGRDPPPPPPVLEEETVKEVLSETPMPKSPTPVVTDSTKRPKVQEGKVESLAPANPTDEIVSELSEICSLSGSFSTTTVTEVRDDDGGEVTQRVRKSPAKIQRKRPYSGELHRTTERGARSPVRSAPSSVPARTVTGQRWNAGPASGIRRDSSEGSGRRSRSPVTRREAGPRRNVRNRSPTVAAATGGSSGRSPARIAGDGKKVIEKANDDVKAETSESLDNPLVSLECFIFL
ncbi:hypothetical protein RJ639_013620 [Escallonia herrerae]|uniref:Serine/arginine repetitive matrix protein 1-like n=1 Tax=Escallonia herrerae TaxID=1293975 RepID=A0AA89AN85_9ASTE|nr:hypothetical protein RJ639_013620 [Escallonia herrerae]